MIVSYPPVMFRQLHYQLDYHDDLPHKKLKYITIKTNSEEAKK